MTTALDGLDARLRIAVAPQHQHHVKFTGCKYEAEVVLDVHEHVALVREYAHRLQGSGSQSSRSSAPSAIMTFALLISTV